MSVTNKQSLIIAIAEVIATKQKDYMIERICNDLGLEPTDYNPSESKRKYVKHRLQSKSKEELLQIADIIIDDLGDTEEEILERELELHSGQYGPVEQLVFASIGLKPDITFDLVNNQINVVNSAGSLIYNRRINHNKGLFLTDLEDWWLGNEFQEKLLNRMYLSLQDNKNEQLFFLTYYKHFQPLLSDALPALIPQVHFNYDPKTISQLGGQRRVTQRMDFLMFLPNKRAIFEIDGAQHYSQIDPTTNTKIANPRLYAQMVAEDRIFRLAGYEVFRFGGYEFLNESHAKVMIIDFFERYLKGNKVY